MNHRKVAEDYKTHIKNWGETGRKPFGLRRFVRYELKIYGVHYPSPGYLDRCVRLVKDELNKINESETKEPAPEFTPKEKSVFPDWMVRDAKINDIRLRASNPDII